MRICNVFFNRRGDMLVFTDESGSFYFFDVTDGTLLFDFQQVIYILVYLNRFIIIIYLMIITPPPFFLGKSETSSIDFENAICKMLFVNKEVLNYKSLDQDV